MKPPSTARTAGRSGGCGGACDASPLSCFLFRPRKSREKCRKRRHTNVSNASVTRASRVSQTLLHPPSLLPSMGITHQKGLGTIVYKTAHVCFRGRKWVHTRLCQQDRTQRLTRRNRGCFGWGRYYYPRSVLRGSETLRGQVSERRTLPLWDLGREVLSKNAENLRDSDALMRVAVPKASRPRWAA